MSKLQPIKNIQAVENKRFRSATTEALILDWAQSAQWMLENIYLGKVGTYELSMRSEADFQSVRGAGWVLADGRDVTGSDFHTLTGQTVIPDLRGRFMRGKQGGRSDGFGNASGDVALGTVAEDSFRTHKHTIIFEAAKEDAGTKVDGSNQFFEAGKSFLQFFGIIHKSITVDLVELGANNIITTGGETCPRYFVVNVFIRINN